jgi:WD40 repeat protein
VKWKATIRSHSLSSEVAISKQFVSDSNFSLETHFSLISGHETCVHCVAFATSAADGDVMLSADDIGVVKIWNLDDRRAKKSFIAGDGAILSLIGLRDSLVTQSKGGLISLWDYDHDSKHPILEVQCDLHSFCKCILLGYPSASSQAAGILIASPTHGGADIGVWDAKSNEFCTRYRPFKTSDALKSSTAGMCTALSTMGDSHVLGAYEDGSVRLWDVRHGSPMSTAKLHAEPIFALSSTPLPTRANGQGQQHVCVSGGADGCVVHTQVSLGSQNTALLAEETGPATAAMTETGRTALGGSGAKGVNSLSVRDDGKITAAACWDGRVRIYANRRPRLLASLRCHTKAAQCVAFAPAGRWLASASEDSRIALWAVYQDSEAPAAPPADASGRELSTEVRC